MNIATLLTRAARADPEQTALRHGAQALSYGALDREASRFGSALLLHGLRPGDRVAVLMRNRLEYASALFGAFRAGLVVVPINAKLHPREAAWIVGNAEAAALVTDSDGAALDSAGRGISGLYAVGRTAASLAASHYASGISLGDGSFFGRRAGRHAAARASRGRSS